MVWFLSIDFVIFEPTRKCVNTILCKQGVIVRRVAHPVYLLVQGAEARHLVIHLIGGVGADLTPLGIGLIHVLVPGMVDHLMTAIIERIIVTVPTFLKVDTIEGVIGRTRLTIVIIIDGIVLTLLMIDIIEGIIGLTLPVIVTTADGIVLTLLMINTIEGGTILTHLMIDTIEDHVIGHTCLDIGDTIIVLLLEVLHLLGQGELRGEAARIVSALSEVPV